MRIAVSGGTGVFGRHTVHALRRAGHDAVVVARARGIDVLTGEGLDDALAGRPPTWPDQSRRARDPEARPLSSVR
jgi:nucleoside-diphosphate-sugar epimerase